MKISDMLTDGNPRSLGNTNEVVMLVLADKLSLPELMDCIKSSDEVVRMRASDALEKVCRQHPEWFKPHIRTLLDEWPNIDQPSVQWHLAQMLGEIELTKHQKDSAISILKDNLNNTGVDWIVAGYSMETLAQFVKNGDMNVSDLVPLLVLQQKHHSKAVTKRATKLLVSITNI